ncbi:RHS repeat-associated core domain-containing protein [Pectobacterium parmentieri]|uniref:RHS repeat-associated core domain-containing protein n=2 Tax=Pectobacterium parmentieri TaxID=1905730 RepID=UPI000B2C68BC|nr:RHS repeat-associated core domain-containing protein [Pectobacterium parmentieri]
MHNPLMWVDPLGLAGDPANATHITYQGMKDGKPYVGYASKPGLGHSAQDVLNYRYGNNFEAFDVKPVPIYKGEGLDGKYTARGLEQRTFEDLGSLGKTSNKQNPVGPNNPRRDDYLAAADRHREMEKEKKTKCPK